MQDTSNLLRYSLFVLTICFLGACNSSGSLSDQPPSFSVFTRQFPELSLPYFYTADSLHQDHPDSARIKNPRRIRFIPDSILFPAGDSVTAIYPVGRGQSKDGTHQWIFVETVRPEAKRVYALVYNEQDSLKAVKKVAAREKREPEWTLTFKWTNNRLLNLYTRQDLGNGFVAYKREVFGMMGAEDRLQLILTNNNDPGR